MQLKTKKHEKSKLNEHGLMFKSKLSKYIIDCNTQQALYIILKNLLLVMATMAYIQINK